MIKVLVIEDLDVARHGLSTLFSAEQDMQIVGCVTNAKQALELLRNGLETDIVLTDLHLGDTCGIALAQTFKELYPAIKIIVITTEADERHLSQGFKAGVKGYLLKDTDFDELLHGIRKVNQGKYFICTGLSEGLTKLIRPVQTQKPAKHIDISKRETEILHLLADGLTNLQIADRLFTSRRTVEGYRQSLINKTGVRNTPALIKFAILNGLLNLQLTGG